MQEDRRVALVTGAALGIGRGIARRLAADGFRLGLTAEREMDETASEVKQAGSHATCVVADLTRPSAAADVVDEVVGEFGRLDVLVNNAGITLTKPIVETSDEDLDMILSVNFKAAWIAIRESVPHMRRQGGGSIVNISSIHGTRGMADHSVYAATKGAIDAMTRQLSIELGGDRIRVNSIRPGLIETERYFQGSTYTSEKGASVIPIGRPGLPQDVAAMVSFLAGEESGFVTGQSIGVDGGSDAQMPIRAELFE